MKAEIDKKTLILNACISVFSKNGYYKSTIEDIAQEAGIGKGTVYLYFSTKEELFEEMFKYAFCEHIKELKNILSKEESVKVIVTNLVNHYKENTERYLDLVQTIATKYDNVSSDKAKKLYNQKRNELKDILFSFIQDGIENNEIRGDIDKYMASISIFAVIEHFFIDKIQNKDDTKKSDESKLIEFIMSILK